MGIGVAKVRKHLGADALLRSVQDVFCQIPDHRKGDPEIPLSDALMSAFALFALNPPSLLAFDQERTEDHLQRVYGMGRVPCDTSMRETLAPVQPEPLRPAFTGGFRHVPYPWRNSTQVKAKSGRRSGLVSILAVQVESNATPGARKVLRESLPT